MASRLCIAEAFTQQAVWCERLGSPFTAKLLEHLRRDFSAGGVTAEILAEWEGDPAAAALPLRLAGGLHALALDGRDPNLADVYPPGRKFFDEITWCAVQAALVRQRSFLRDFLTHAPQTNEVRRSIVLLGGFLELSRRFHLPLELFEIGASAGLNLAWPDFRYLCDSWSWGRKTSPLALTTAWDGSPPPVSENPPVVARAGCDIRPLDLADRSDRLRLQAYVWANQEERLSNLRAAMDIVGRAGIRVEAASADEWLPRRLAGRRHNACAVVYHSIVRQYFGPGVQARIEETLQELGETATPTAPMAHLSFEPEDDGYALRLRTWPGGPDQKLATADPHGRWVRWRGDPA